MAIVFFFGNAVLVSLTDLYMSNTRARCHSLGTVKVSYHSLNSKKLSNKDSQFDEYPQCGGSSSEGPFDDLKSRGCLAGRTLLVQGANMFLICANHFFSSLFIAFRLLSFLNFSSLSLRQTMTSRHRWLSKAPPVRVTSSHCLLDTFMPSCSGFSSLPLTS